MHSRFGYLDRSFGGGSKIDSEECFCLSVGSIFRRAGMILDTLKPVFLFFVFLLWIGTLDLVFATFWIP